MSRLLMPAIADSTRILLHEKILSILISNDKGLTTRAIHFMLRKQINRSLNVSFGTTSNMLKEMKCNKMTLSDYRNHQTYWCIYQPNLIKSTKE
jgi:hypothetical protein